VVVSSFEQWPLPPEPFDLVLSATAFHWIDPVVRVIKAADALRPGGSLATITTHHIVGGDAGFFVESQACYERWDPETPPGGIRLPTSAEVPTSGEELERSGRFGPPSFHRYEWELAYSTDAYLALLQTYSGHRALGPEARRGLLACIGDLIARRYEGKIAKRYLTELCVAHCLAV
jgi:SAM-dependent methyltransferase